MIAENDILQNDAEKSFQFQAFAEISKFRPGLNVEVLEGF